MNKKLFGALVVLFFLAGLIAPLVLIRNSSAEKTVPAEVSTERFHSKEGPDLLVYCWKGLTFVGTHYNSGVIQILDETGKPMTCEK